MKILDVINKITSMVSDYCELLLPFKNDEKTLQNNKYQALQIPKHLKNKFERNSTFCSYYKEFLDTLLINRDISKN